MDPIITSVTEQDSTTIEESLIDRDTDVSDVEITISPISVSRSNLSDIIGKSIPFLEAVQATIVPYAVEIAFPFPEFVGWCANNILMKKGSLSINRGPRSCVG
jgi:hypothetical protein